MRILQACIRYPPASGGVETHVQEISRRMIGAGHQVTVATTDLRREHPFERFDGDVDTEDEKEPKVERYHATRLPGIAYVVSPSMKAIRRMGLDIMHTHSYGYYHTNLVAWAARRRKDVPAVCTPHFHPVYTMLGGHLRRIVRRTYDAVLAKWIMRSFDAVVCVSSGEMAELERHVARERITVIPNGIDFDLFREPPEPSVFREKYDVDGKMLLYTGRLAQNKRLEKVIGILPDLVKEFPDLTFVAAGEDNGMQAEWEALAKEKGVADHVRFPGHLPYEDLLASYSACDVYVLPSDYEAFGIVLLEAMASRRPCVGTRVGGIPDVIDDGVTGHVVDYDDDVKLRNRLFELLNDGALADRMGAAGRERVERLFTWDSVTERILTLYDELIEKRK